MNIEKEIEIFESVLNGFYSIGKVIGRGGFGKVVKATHLVTGEKVAIKIINKLAIGEDLPRVDKEILALQKLSHIHVCKLFQFIQNEEYIFLVIEYCDGGELFDYIAERERLDENEARRIFIQIASAVSYIHRRGVAHRDLKPENILLDEKNDIKLIDFGLCAQLSRGFFTKLETCCGSPCYAAPELIKGEKYYGPQADVWSLGVLLYALLNGFLPFDDIEMTILFKKIQEGNYFEPKWLSEGSKNILRCMLQVNPEFRLSIDDLLKHTWCKDSRDYNYETLFAEEELFAPTKFLDSEVLRFMGRYFGVRETVIENKLTNWNFEDYDLATYLILLERKRKHGGILMQYGMNPYGTYKTANRGIKKSLALEFLACESFTTISPRPYHSSMEGGLDDKSLLLIGSPKEDKENSNRDQFLKPKNPSPKKLRMPEESPLTMAKKILSPAKSAESVLHDSVKTPTRELWKSIGQNSPMPSPSKRKMLGSIERGLDKFKNMLTPSKIKNKNKLKTIPANKLVACNTTITHFEDPDFVIGELKDSLAKIGIETEQNGYRLIGKVDRVSTLKFELQIVLLQETNTIGIRRKRITGESFEYKKIIEKIIGLSKITQNNLRVLDKNYTPNKEVQTPKRPYTAKDSEIKTPTPSNQYKKDNIKDTPRKGIMQTNV